MSRVEKWLIAFFVIFLIFAVWTALKIRRQIVWNHQLIEWVTQEHGDPDPTRDPPEVPSWP